MQTSQVAVYFPGFFLLGALSIIAGFVMTGLQGRLYARISGV